jgi:hypothetical protein
MRPPRRRGLQLPATLAVVVVTGSAVTCGTPEAPTNGFGGSVAHSSHAHAATGSGGSLFAGTSASSAEASSVVASSSAIASSSSVASSSSIAASSSSDASSSSSSGDMG